MAGDFRTTNGSQLFISPTSVTSATDSLPEFEAISDWVKVGNIEDLGEVGDEATMVTGATIEDGRIRKAKGARDAGTQAVICFHDPLDVGQLALIDAEATKFNYPFKLIVNDAPSEAYSNTIQYYRGLVGGKRLRMGTNDNIMRRTFNIAVNSEVFEDAASTA
jgi:hypothetical protein